jgi:hypothetical protein
MEIFRTLVTSHYQSLAKVEILMFFKDLNKHRNKSSSSAKSSKQPQANTSKASTSKQPAATSKKIKKNDDDDEDTDVEEVDDDVPKTPKKQILKKVEADNEEDDDDEDNEADQKFETFCKLCDKLSAQSGSTAKTEILKDFISSNKYDLKLLIRFLLPNSSNRVYNLNSVSLVKLYAKGIN